MADTTRFYGVSQPISLALPDTNDIKLSNELIECLQSKNLIENEQELQKRIDVLCNITNLVKEFIRIVTKQKMIGSEEDTTDFGGKIFTLGSYRLGVHNRGADIDTLCVAPRHVDRKDFFKVFYDLLAADANVTDLHAVEEAFVPVIKLNYSGIELDILFARLALKEIPDNQSLLDDNLLKNLDEKSIRSLNGSRVASEILNSIPNPETYVVVLRSIKYWATTHGIYSNVLGYFGGISWAILVARICQLYPNAAPAKLLQKFFYVFKQWTWPSPVFLKEIDMNRQEISTTLSEMVWDPRIRASDRLHLMPIITPAYPEQNSTYNVTNSTKKVIVSELEEAALITDDIYAGKASWDRLFEPVNFFTRYKHFVAVLCAAKTEEDHLNYVGFIESRMRFLTAAVERHDAVICVQVNTKQFKPLNLERFTFNYEDPVANLWFLGLELDANLARTLDLTSEITQFLTTVQQHQQAAPQRYNEHMKIDVKYVAQKDVKYYLSRDDFLYGRRYVKRKPVLSRTSSEVGSPARNIQDETKPSEQPTEAAADSTTEIDTSLASVENNNVTTENDSRSEIPSKPVFCFGAENNIMSDISDSKTPEDSPAKAVLQESVNSLPMDGIIPENIKPLTEIGIKRSMEEEATDVSPEKKLRSDVTVA